MVVAAEVSVVVGVPVVVGAVVVGAVVDVVAVEVGDGIAVPAEVLDTGDVVGVVEVAGPPPGFASPEVCGESAESALQAPSHSAAKPAKKSRRDTAMARDVSGAAPPGRASVSPRARSRLRSRR